MEETHLDEGEKSNPRVIPFFRPSKIVECVTSIIEEVKQGKFTVSRPA